MGGCWSGARSGLCSGPERWFGEVVLEEEEGTEVQVGKNVQVNNEV